MLFNFFSRRYRSVITCIYLLITMLSQRHLYAQPLFNGSRNATLSHAAVSMPGNQWPDVNPSSIASIKRSSLSFFASEGYSLREMRTGAINVSLPTPKQVYGVMVQSFGYDQYRDLNIITTIGRQLKFGASRKLSIGLSIMYNRVTIRHIGSQNRIALSSGLTIEFWPNLYLGASARQLISHRPTAALEEEFRLGIGYQLLKESWVVVAIQKSISHQPVLSAGLESPIEPGIVMRIRMSTNPYRVAMGADFRLNSLEVGILAEKHIILNWTPALSVGLPF